MKKYRYFFEELKKTWVLFQKNPLQFIFVIVSIDAIIFFTKDLPIWGSIGASIFIALIISFYYGFVEIKKLQNKLMRLISVGLMSFPVYIILGSSIAFVFEAQISLFSIMQILSLFFGSCLLFSKIVGIRLIVSEDLTASAALHQGLLCYKKNLIKYIFINVFIIIGLYLCIISNGLLSFLFIPLLLNLITEQSIRHPRPSIVP